MQLFLACTAVLDALSACSLLRLSHRVLHHLWQSNLYNTGGTQPTAAHLHARRQDANESCRARTIASHLSLAFAALQ